MRLLGPTPGASLCTPTTISPSTTSSHIAKTITRKRVWVRYQAVILATQGRSAAAIAQALGCSERAVQKWIARYNQGGRPGPG